MKRLLSLSLFLMTAMLSFAFEVDGIYYEIILSSAPYTVEVTRYDQYTGAVNIPATVTYNGKTYSVTSIGKYAFLDCRGLTSIIIPNSVTTIRDGAFEYCSGLTSVTINSNSIISKTYSSESNLKNIFGSQVKSYIIGDGVTSIGNSAFEDCSGLTSVTIGNSVTSIGDYAFYGCSGLTSITIPNSVTTIGWGAFSGCSGLTSVTIPNSVTSIGDFAFSGCSGLTSITIPNSVTSIGGYAFYGCSGLTSVAIPNSVTNIGSSAFEGCSGLTSVSIPNSVPSIGDKAFSGCGNLGSVEINSNAILSKSYTSSSSLVNIFGNQVQNYVIGNDVTSIGDCAFYKCSGLTSVTIPNSVTSIGKSAFYGCSGLKSVTIPSSVTSIGNGAFSNCSGLTSITIPNSVTSIGSYAFYKCSGLTSITIPNSVTSIGNYAFYNCSGLTSIVVEKGNTKYDSRNNCNAIIETASNTLISGCKTTVIPNSVTTIGGYAFAYCSGLTSITIPNSVTSIGSRVFSGCSGLTSVTIGNSVTTLGEEMFYGCSGLTSVTIPNSVTSIGSRVFSGCSGLTSVTIGNSVTSIGSWAFDGCSGLTSVTINSNSIISKEYSSTSNLSNIFGSQVKSYIIGDGVTAIGDYAFALCNDLTSVTIPNSVTSIGSYAFYNCSGLTSVTIGNSVTTIGSGAFYGCSGLIQVNIPNSVTSIGNSAFSSCSGLTSVTINSNSIISNTESSLSNIFGSQVKSYIIGDGVTSIGSYAFYNCSDLKSVTIPNSVTSIGNSAFSGCSGLKKVIVPDIAAWCNISFSNNTANPLYYAKHIYSDENTEIKDLVIPNSVTSIGSDAFSDCSGLTSVTIPSSVTTIGSFAFQGCSGLTSITIPSSVTSIGSVAFYGCSGLTSVTIPNSVTSIGDWAFYGCSGLKSVTIPNSVTSIGSYAFDGCSGLSTVILPDDLVSIGYNTFPKKSTTRLYVNIGSKTLLALWNDKYDYVYEIGSQNRLQPSSSLYLSSSTQTSLTFNIDSKYSGYTFTCDGNNIGSGGITKTGLYPGQSQSFSITVKKDDLSHSFSEEFRTKDIAPIVSGIVSASSIKATGSYTKGDAVVTKTVIKCNGKEIEGDNLSVCGLTPNKSYTVDYIITVQGNKTYEDSKTFKTSELTMATEQPKVVSVGNVIVSAKANVDDAETNVGFEWRRTDWTDEFKSNTGTAYMYEGTMEGYIRNLYAEKLWKFRPYYLADDGTYYYGDWMGLDPTNTSYFEPTVHTYANINIEGNTALVKGYALGGTDKITVQGFKYWKAANLAPSGDLALEARKASPAIPADAQAIEAEGRVMEATLSGLDYECTYSYVAFAKTDEGTFYGEVKTFTTGPNTTGIEVVHDADSETKAVDDKVKGIYTLTGVKLSDDAVDLKTLKRGIYIVNGRKVAVK